MSGFLSFAIRLSGRKEGGDGAHPFCIPYREPDAILDEGQKSSASRFIGGGPAATLGFGDVVLFGKLFLPVLPIGETSATIFRCGPLLSFHSGDFSPVNIVP